jgi:C4-dicarboxylate-binding protein DctP
LNVTDAQKIAASGYSQMIRLTPEQREAWVNAMKPVWTKFEASIGKDVIDAAIAANGAS